jgi:hypothetical protein
MMLINGEPRSTFVNITMSLLKNLDQFLIMFTRKIQS